MKKHRHAWRFYKDQKKVQYCEIEGCGIDRKAPKQKKQKHNVLVNEVTWSYIEQTAKISGRSTDDVVNVMIAFFLVKIEQ